MFASLLIVFDGYLGSAQAAKPSFEYPGTIPTSLVAGPIPLEGPGYSVREHASVVDYYGRFVLQTDFGLLSVDGADMLALRIKELEALRELDRLSAGAVMVESGGRRLRKPVDQVVQVVGSPADTTEGVPAGIGRFLLRGARRVSRIALDLSDAARDQWAESTDAGVDNGIDPPSERSVSERGGKLLKQLALREIGYRKIRRGLARHLGVDPYSSNPLLRERLDQLAWAAWVGDRGVSWGLGAVISKPLDAALDVVGDAHELVWEIPPEDIERRNAEVLASLGLDGKPVRDFLRNGAFNPLRQIAFVEQLAKPGYAAVRAEFLELAIDAQNEREARFLLDLMAGLDKLALQSPGLPRIGLVGMTPVLDSGDGRLSVVLPVDYVAWTQTTAAFALRADLLEHQPRLMVRGKVTAQAKQALGEAGWEVVEGWDPIA